MQKYMSRIWNFNRLGNLSTTSRPPPAQVPKVPLKNDTVDSGGFFVACLIRLQVGELCEKPKTEKNKSDVDPKSGAHEPEPVKRAKVSTNDDTQMQTIIETDASLDASKVASPRSELLREGDWICEACGTLNFGRRDSPTCIGCKKRRPKTANTEEKITRQPLLKTPCLQTELEPLLNFFGISSSNSVFQNVRVIHRKRERTFVLVSAPVAALSISEKWGAFREAGISICTMSAIPSVEEESTNANHAEITTLYDEAVPILALHAKKRHIKIEPLSFQTALAQSILEDLKKETVETERIKATLDIPLTPLCGNEPWYESHKVAMESGVLSCLVHACSKVTLGGFHFGVDVTPKEVSQLKQAHVFLLQCLLCCTHTYL